MKDTTYFKEEDTMNEMFKEYPDVVTIEDVMSMLGIGRNLAYKLVRTGEIRSIKVGRRMIIPKKEIVRFLTLPD